ncbi:hypothetical protein [Massilia sp. TS11]|uniref:hypothetical protein n=1 Tax=Massilia sp. TS11 TaxID=2908003 RepID=UPI001EDA8AD5|nr:hypothetical protein [Massilia sp. TS11]MCG2585988.1 hypothetical protein [Massilia sp. TS11]
MDLARHLQRINESIEELQAFSPRTSAPAPIPHQYIGTIIDNTIGLLTAPANAVDKGSRNVQFAAPSNWLSLMQAVHRSFFSSLMSAVEKGLTHICQTKEIPIKSKQGEKLLAKVSAIQSTCTNAGLEIPELAELEKHFAAFKPTFADHLDSTLEATLLDKEAKKKWRRFFRALSIVRNKASHSDTTLTNAEREDLRSGGCEVMIDERNELVLNPRMYAQAAYFALQFFEELHRAFPQERKTK